jgi:hypothetical protein
MTSVKRREESEMEIYYERRRRGSKGRTAKKKLLFSRDFVLERIDRALVQSTRMPDCLL